MTRTIFYPTNRTTVKEMTLRNKILNFINISWFEIDMARTSIFTRLPVFIQIRLLLSKAKRTAKYVSGISDWKLSWSHKVCNTNGVVIQYVLNCKLRTHTITNFRIIRKCTSVIIRTILISIISNQTFFNTNQRIWIN